MDLIMKVTTIKDKLNKYEVITGVNAFSFFLDEFNFPSKVMVITTKKILALCDNKIKNKGFDFIFVGEKETEKNIDNYLFWLIFEFLLILSWSNPISGKCLIEASHLESGH